MPDKTPEQVLLRCGKEWAATRRPGFQFLGVAVRLRAPDGLPYTVEVEAPRLRRSPLADSILAALADAEGPLRGKDVAKAVRRQADAYLRRELAGLVQRGLAVKGKGGYKIVENCYPPLP